MSTSAICKNCDRIVVGKFCSHCGQAGNTYKVNFKFLWNDFRFLLFSYDRSIFDNLKDLLIRPGLFISDFLVGRRVKKFSPLRLTITLGGVYTALYYTQKISITLLTSNLEINHKSYSPALVENWLISHYALFSLLTIPFWAASTYVFFKKRKWTFAEHIATSGFIVCQHICVKIIFLLIAIIAKQLNTLLVIKIPELISFIMSVYTYNQLFKNYYKPIILNLRILFTFLITVITFTLFVAIIIISYEQFYGLQKIINTMENTQ